MLAFPLFLIRKNPGNSNHQSCAVYVEDTLRAIIPSTQSISISSQVDACYGVITQTVRVVSSNCLLFFRTYLPWFPPKYVKSQVIFVVGRVFFLFTIVSGNVQCYKAVGQWAINRNIQIDPRMWTRRVQSLYDAMYKSLCTCMY